MNTELQCMVEDCNLPATNISPSGKSAYCQFHGQCSKGHAIDWTLDIDGRYVCKCVVDGRAEILKKQGKKRKKVA